MERALAIARARDAGRFVIDAKASSIDPMQADICGIALALAPNDAAYMPLAHKRSGDGVGLFFAANTNTIPQASQTRLRLG